MVQTGTVDKVVLDRRGIVLPVEDIDTSKVGRTILINGEGIVAPTADREGLVWKTETPERPELAQLDRYVLKAAKLAGFLLEPRRKREAEQRSELAHPGDRLIRLAERALAIPPERRGRHDSLGQGFRRRTSGRTVGRGKMANHG